MKTIKDIVEDTQKEHLAKIETYLSLRIQSKPKWLPAFLWKAILRRVLVIRYFKERSHENP